MGPKGQMARRQALQAGLGEAGDSHHDQSAGAVGRLQLRARGTHPHVGSARQLARFALKTVLFFVWLDFAFYWEHRLAHHPALYKYVHKQHHLFKQSVAVAYEFAHPAEGLLVNGLPLFIGLYFAHMHLAQVCLFLFIRITETIDAHSGYDFPWSPWRYLSGARAHDLHHSKQVGNFGIFHFWDWFCSTTVEDMRQARQEKQS